MQKSDELQKTEEQQKNDISEETHPANDITIRS